jgi:hypothetical protein
MPTESLNVTVFTLTQIRVHIKIMVLYGRKNDGLLKKLPALFYEPEFSAESSHRKGKNVTSTINFA